jgi:hypothetical protein
LFVIYNQSIRSLRGNVYYDPKEMEEVLVPVIKEEPNSDSEADPLSSGIDLRNVKVGYVKKFATCPYYKRIYEWSVPISYILDTYFLSIFTSQSCLHGLQDY